MCEFFIMDSNILTTVGADGLLAVTGWLALPRDRALVDALAPAACESKACIHIFCNTVWTDEWNRTLLKLIAYRYARVILQYNVLLEGISCYTNLGRESRGRRLLLKFRASERYNPNNGNLAGDDEEDFLLRTTREKEGSLARGGLNRNCDRGEIDSKSSLTVLVLVAKNFMFVFY